MKWEVWAKWETGEGAQMWKSLGHVLPSNCIICLRNQTKGFKKLVNF